MTARIALGPRAEAARTGLRAAFECDAARRLWATVSLAATRGSDRVIALARHVRARDYPL